MGAKSHGNGAKLMADFLINLYGQRRELVRCFVGRKWRASPIKTEFYIGIRDQVILNGIIRGFGDALDLAVIGIAHIPFGICLIGDNVAACSAFHDGPVHRGFLLRIAQVLKLKQLMRQLGDGVATFFRRGPGVRRDSLDLEKYIIDSIGRGRDVFLFGRFKGQGVAMLASEFADQFT